MSRSRVALLGVCGVIGASLLVSPLVNWQDSAPTGPTGAYDALLSEASCGESDSQLALSNRPAQDPTLQLASLDKDEIAFLEGIQPAGGEGDGTGTGGDGPSGNGPLDEVLKDLDDQTKNGSGDPNDPGGPGGGPGPGGPFQTSFVPDGGKPGDPGDPGDPGNPPGNPPGKGPDDGDGPGDEKCIENCGDQPPIQKIVCTENCGDSGGENGVYVSEPATLGLLGLGLVLLGVRRRRSK